MDKNHNELCVRVHGWDFFKVGFAMVWSWLIGMVSVLAMVALIATVFSSSNFVDMGSHETVLRIPGTGAKITVSRNSSSVKTS